MQMLKISMCFVLHVLCLLPQRTDSPSYTNECCFYTGATKMVADVIRAALVETGSTDMLDWAKPRNSYPNA